MTSLNDKHKNLLNASNQTGSTEGQSVDQNYELFKKKIYNLTGLCLDKYKERQMKRRLNSLMNLYDLTNFLDYFKLLASDEAAKQKFLDRTTINVSEFFRNPEKFAELSEKILPDLYRRFRVLKVWSAGCSIGTEPYTLAIILSEMGVNNFQILASDLDTEILRQAAEGIYTAEQIKNVNPFLQKKYFEKEGDKFKVKASLKSQIKLKKHDLLEQPFERNFQLILCRNVVIYFTEEAKSILYKKFADALMPGGVLFIGNTERVFGAEQLGLENFSTFFYRKKG